MSSDHHVGMLTDDLTKIVLKNMIDTGRAGLFFWNRVENSFEVMETLTDKDYKNVKTLEDFIEQYVF